MPPAVSDTPLGQLDVISAAHYGTHGYPHGTHGYPHEAWARLRREAPVCRAALSFPGPIAPDAMRHPAAAGADRENRT